MNEGPRSDWWATWLLLALIAASRWWLLDTGFGSDADAWRVASSGHWLGQVGDYVVSRRPGYPLVELLMAGLLALEELLRGPGWLVANTFTCLLFVCQCILLHRLARRLHAAHPLALTAAYALHPV
ncbi:MAG: hypothetical protein ACE5G2_07745, partial [Candidatus Krumholzibacteriia bacterium]